MGIIKLPRLSELYRAKRHERKKMIPEINKSYRSFINFYDLRRSINMDEGEE